MYSDHIHTYVQSTHTYTQTYTVHAPPPTTTKKGKKNNALSRVSSTLCTFPWHRRLLRDSKEWQVLYAYSLCAPCFSTNCSSKHSLSMSQACFVVLEIICMSSTKIPSIWSVLLCLIPLVAR